jgi:hypothetical protein
VIAANANKATKIRSIVCVIPGKSCRQRRGSPRRDHLRGPLNRGDRVRPPIPTIRALGISPPDHVQYVAAVRHQRDLIPPESCGLTARVVPVSAPTGCHRYRISALPPIADIDHHRIDVHLVPQQISRVQRGREQRLSDGAI